MLPTSEKVPLRVRARRRSVRRCENVIGNELEDGVHTRLDVFNYEPREVRKHPWSEREASDPWNLPRFFLTNRDGFVGARDEDWDRRDTVVGFGSNHGCFASRSFS